jgi:hypothetical protein
MQLIFLKKKSTLCLRIFGGVESLKLCNDGTHRFRKIKERGGITDDLVRLGVEKMLI